MATIERERIMNRITVPRRSLGRGFTLVEVVVVAVIVAVLAAVSIPLYNGYIASTRQTAVENLANTAAAAANTYYRKNGDTNMSLGTLNIFYDSAQQTITLDKVNKAVTVTSKTDATITKTVSYAN
jgi:prepilin-type N-terminal cleavage/methylation domain-containing protein